MKNVFDLSHGGSDTILMTVQFSINHLQKDESTLNSKFVKINFSEK